METNHLRITHADVEYIPISEFIKALEKNGYEHIRAQYIATNHKKFLGLFWKKSYAACAMGQAALNLNAYPLFLTEALDKYTDGIGTRIIHMNDSAMLPYKEIVKRAKELLRPYRYKTIPIIKKHKETSWVPVIDLYDENVLDVIQRGQL